MARPIIFGNIQGISEGHWFAGRKEMMATSFHRNWGAGIDGNGKEGASAIVLSGGYEDDRDLGDEIIYTGAGGNDTNTGKQVEDQTWTNRGNAGLVTSMNKGLPIRVIRGHQHKSDFSPSTGYTYAGLYSVVDAWEETGKSGYKICRFRLVYSGTNPDRIPVEKIELDYSKKKRRVKEGTVVRVVRDTSLANSIKELYNYECQVCETSIQTSNGKYAEGAHIKPLGTPHEGEDATDNLLCLCPNHHVMFDRGGFAINDDLELIGNEHGSLKMHSKHRIDTSNLQYHRKAHGYD